MAQTNLTDEELWKSIRQDDRKAFAVLFDRYWAKLYTTACYHLKDTETCSEIVHDIFLNIWKGRRQLQIDSFPGYLSAAVRYHVFRYRKALRANPLLYQENWETNSELSIANRGGDDMIYNELQQEVFRSMRNLPKRCQEIFILSRRQNLTNDQIAEQLGISKRTVENQITQALQFLRISIKEILSLFIFISIYWL